VGLVMWKGREKKVFIGVCCRWKGGSLGEKANRLGVAEGMDSIADSRVVCGKSQRIVCAGKKSGRMFCCAILL
jgi:hypothetical protein